MLSPLRLQGSVEWRYRWLRGREPILDRVFDDFTIA